MHDREVLPAQFFLKPGYIMANRDATMVRMVLGNCVAVTVFDQMNCFGGVHQFVFPETSELADMTPQYGNVGIRALMRMMLDMGARRDGMVAQIVGGAANTGISDKDLGRKNATLARTMLEQLRVPVISEDIGGRLGRKVLYHSGTNEMAIFKVDNLRNNDWFVPGMDLRYDDTGR